MVGRLLGYRLRISGRSGSRFMPGIWGDSYLFARFGRARSSVINRR
jgi:hypothetical protein